MPDRKIHERITELFLGEKFSNVHAAIDGPSSSLGPNHRRLFHDPETAALIGFEVAGRDGALAAVLHILTDEVWDKDMEEIFKIAKGKVPKKSSMDLDERNHSDDRWKRWKEELKKSFQRG